MKKIILLAQVFILGQFSAQTLTPQVINAAGGHRQLGSSGVYITDNVGEPFIQTVGSNTFMLTQGFIQPVSVSKAGFTTSVIYQDLKCVDKEDDAFISVAITSPISNYTVQYFWTPSSVCPNNDCAKIDSLKPGIYAVKPVVKYKNNLGTTVTDSLLKTTTTILNATTPCKVVIFSGVTPNNDGNNDVWTIDDINEFPNNSVMIFNRWGQKVYEEKGYNNRSKSWPNADQLNNLPASTYFYVVDLGDKSPLIKGWVELIKN